MSRSRHDDLTASPASPTSRAPDSPEVRALCEVGLALVPMLVQQMRRDLMMRLTGDELTSYAQEGALMAARTFDATQGVPFKRWASMKIRRTIIDGLRSEGDLPRGLYKKLRAIEALNWTQEGMDLEASGVTPAPPPPGTPEAADVLIRDRLATMALALAASGMLRADEEELEDVEDRSGSPEEELAREELKAVVRMAIAERPDNERSLLERYYFDGLTMEQASGGLSKSWASRVHARAIGGVAKALQRAKVSL